MKRQIKFRAWVKKPNECYMAIQGTPDLETLQSFIFHYGNEDLEQFTGIIDINKREMFEGDIVKFTRNIGNYQTGNSKPFTTIHQIIWDENICRFGLSSKSEDTQKLRKHNGYTYEIVGNIHEN